MKTNRIPPGRWCAVRDLLGGGIIEAIKVAGGVRLQTGEHFGERRVVGEYELLEQHHPAGPALTVLAELNEL